MKGHSRAVRRPAAPPALLERLAADFGGAEHNAGLNDAGLNDAAFSEWPIVNGQPDTWPLLQQLSSGRHPYGQTA
ncbi:hypothetical protein, partial [Herbidospora mongoliensis]|uniref:hypothetical protein n=1 Tax=Herbidospora mongoliensis TaxID=688067 RepID=UPI001C3F2FAC